MPTLPMFVLGHLSRMVPEAAVVPNSGPGHDCSAANRLMYYFVMVVLEERAVELP